MLPPPPVQSGEGARSCRLRDAAPELAQATCLAVACPACMTVELARSCAPYVTTIVNNCDIVPTISPGAFAPRLRPPVPCLHALSFGPDLKCYQSDAPHPWVPYYISCRIPHGGCSLE